jgi:hypothetical protein
VRQNCSELSKATEQMFRAIFENTELGFSFSDLDGGDEDPWLAAIVLVREAWAIADFREA